jgi:uncharacterized protein DUF6056
VSTALREGTEPRGWLRSLGFERAFLGGFFLVFTALAFLFPRTGDDWAWGSSIGTDRLDVWFRNYNGRYAGNLAVLALTRTPVLAQLVTGAVVTLIVFLIVDLAGNRTPLGYLAVTTVLLGMPHDVWRQSIVWISGFTNYGFATAAALGFLWAAKRDWTGRLAASGRWRRAPIVLVYGFVAALFMENVTIYLVIAAIAYVIAYRKVFGRFSVDSVAWLLAFVAGAAVMFSNGAYRAAANSKTNYQQIQTGGGGLKDDVEMLGDRVYLLAVSGNTMLNVALVLAVGLLAGAVAGSVGWRRARLPIALVGAFLVANETRRVVVENTSPAQAWRTLGGYAGGLLLLGGLCAAAIVLVRDRARRVQLLVAVASIVLLIGPMAAVHPIGPRCFFASYVFFLIVMAGLLKELAERSDIDFAPRLAPFVAAVGTSLLVSYFVVYALVTHAVQRRLDDVRAAVRDGATTVQLARLPFRSYVHYGEPIRPIWQRRFKLYYDLPADLHVVVKTEGRK